MKNPDKIIIGYVEIGKGQFIWPTSNDGIIGEDSRKIIQGGIVLRGMNGSSITVKTDLTNMNFDTRSLLGKDFGGNYTFEGDDILVAVLDIAGVLDPSPISDIFATKIEFDRGNYFGAALSGLGTISYIGDTGKIIKLPKHIKTINKAIDGVKKIGPIPDTSIKKQAGNLKKNLNGGKNSVTIDTPNGRTRYDLEGRAHNDVDTPHKQSYKVNTNPKTGQTNMSRTSKNATPMNQQDMRTVRKTLEKRNQN